MSAVEARKPLITVVDPDADRGGLTMDEVRTQLLETVESSFPRWGFDESAPSGEVLFDVLASGAASWRGSKSSPGSKEVEWNRIGVFQEVSLRLIAERLLSKQRRRESAASLSEDARQKSACSPRRLSAAIINRRLSLQDSAPTDSTSLGRKSAFSPRRLSGAFVKRHSSLQEPSRGNTVSSYQLHAALTYVQSDITRKAYILPAPRRGRRFHLYCSREVYGSLEVAEEVQAAYRLDLRVSQELDDMRDCERMLVYLHKGTWRTGPAREAFTQEVVTALHCGVQLLLAHEMLGADAEARGGVDFATFFDCEQGTTPPQLVRAGVYSQIAVALKGGQHRKVSMALFAKALVEAPEEVRPITVSSSLKLDTLASSTAAGRTETPAATQMVLHDGDDEGIATAKKAGFVQWLRRRMRPAAPILSCMDSRSDENPRRASIGQSTTV